MRPSRFTSASSAALALLVTLFTNGCATDVAEDEVAAATEALMPSVWTPDMPLAFDTPYWVEAEGTSRATSGSAIGEDGTVYAGGGCAIAIARANDVLERALDRAFFDCRSQGGSLWIGADASVFGLVDITGDRGVLQLPARNACSGTSPWHFRAVPIECVTHAFVDVPGQIQWCGDQVVQSFVLDDLGMTSLAFEQWAEGAIELAARECAGVPGGPGRLRTSTWIGLDSTNRTTATLSMTCQCGPVDPRRRAVEGEGERAIGLPDLTTE